MSAGVSSSYPGTAPARHGGTIRAWAGLLGVGAVVVGLFLLFHPYSAARTLAVLIGLALIVGGLLEMTGGWLAPAERRWSAVVEGLVLVIGGVLAAFWPHVTLAVLAVLTGVVLILHGVGRLAFAWLMRGEVPGTGWLVAAGVLNVAVGVLAIVWPKATVLVLSVLFGIQILLFGLVLTAAALLIPRADHAPDRS